MNRILALPGSLRQNSSSNRILRTVVSLASVHGITIEIFEGLGELPHFNDPPTDPLVVKVFKDKIREADAILICTPEYAFGIPGSLKNAIDWTVGSGEFVDKPVGLITASSQGERGHAALLLVLSAVSAKVIDRATILISSIRSRFDSDGNIKDGEIIGKLNDALSGFVDLYGRK